MFMTPLGLDLQHFKLSKRLLVCSANQQTSKLEKSTCLSANDLRPKRYPLAMITKEHACNNS
jgi:hypothetical protein